MNPAICFHLIFSCGRLLKVPQLHLKELEIISLPGAVVKGAVSLHSMKRKLGLSRGTGVAVHLVEIQNLKLLFSGLLLLR